MINLNCVVIIININLILIVTFNVINLRCDSNSQFVKFLVGMIIWILIFIVLDLVLSLVVLIGLFIIIELNWNYVSLMFMW